MRRHCDEQGISSPYGRAVERWLTIVGVRSGPRGLAPGWLAVLLLAVLTWPVAVAAAEKRVLVLYAAGRLLPANIEFDQSFRETLKPSNAVVFDEFLDMTRFSEPAQQQTFVRYLQDKYASHPPDVVVVGGDDTLRFMVENRAQLFPNVPVVYSVTSSALLQSLGELPADYIGEPAGYFFAESIELGLRWHPHTKRLVLVTGSSPSDIQMEIGLKQIAADLSQRVEVEFFTGLPTPQLLAKLQALAGDTLVFTPGYFKDGAGVDFTPRDSAKLMADSLSVPMYSAFTSFLEAGIVGGYMLSWADLAEQAGNVVNDLLAGATPATLTRPEPQQPSVHVNWPVAQRWGLDESDFPPGTVVHFREPTVFEQYGPWLVGVALVVLLQATLISTLLLERRRRRLAEGVMHERSVELAHASRLAVAGQLTASIAHEINQPLAAILTNAETAELLLASGQDHQHALQQILTAIRQDDLRASEVTRRLRLLLEKQEQEHRPIELNQVLEDVAGLLRNEGLRRKISVIWRPANTSIKVQADRVQLQQVLINLILNAMDAMVGVDEERRRIEVVVAVLAEVATIRITDQGHGIAAEHLPSIFDPFFTRKEDGMGLGLSIVQRLVEAHGGTVQVERSDASGTVFRLALPVLSEVAG